jgi:hypothetical protein
MIGNTIVVGFGYKARRGKDTAVTALVKAFSRVATRYAFGDALKSEVDCAKFDQYMQDGMPMADWNPTRGMRHLCKWAGVPYTEGESKQRALLQWWGTEYRRAESPDYWVNILKERLALEQPKYALIPDVRFLNEFMLCDYTVRMDRPGFEIDDGRHHISEVGLDALPASSWTHIIEATATEQVQQKAIGFFRKILSEGISAYSVESASRSER